MSTQMPSMGTDAPSIPWVLVPLVQTCSNFPFYTAMNPTAVEINIGLVGPDTAKAFLFLKVADSKRPAEIKVALNAGLVIKICNAQGRPLIFPTHF